LERGVFRLLGWWRSNRSAQAIHTTTRTAPLGRYAPRLFIPSASEGAFRRFGKIAVLLRILQLSNRNQGSSVTLIRHLHWMHLYGKWSMLDVFVVAVLLASVKLGALAQVQIHNGLYAFAASVLLTMLITARVTYLTQSPGAEA